jgi:hypothetical protein
VWLNKQSSAFDLGNRFLINIKFQAKFNFFKQALQLDKHRIHPTAQWPPVSAQA